MRAFGRAQVGPCEQLGATFIKVGQITSTRGDLLPPEAVDEFPELRDQVPPFPFADVQRVAEPSLGSPLAAVDVNFEREPVTAASVAPVHRSTSSTGSVW